MAISYQTRDRGGGGGKRTRVMATVRRDGVSVSATFGTAWAVPCQTAIEQATQVELPFDRATWLRRGRAKTLDETVADVAQLGFERKPDTDPTPRAEWTLGRALDHHLLTVTPAK